MFPLGRSATLSPPAMAELLSNASWRPQTNIVSSKKLKWFKEETHFLSVTHKRER